MNMCGLLNLNKPVGMTSREAVDRIQRLVRPAKVGHAGTLDPLASGVLVVGVGAATRLLEYVQQMPKRYTGTFLLGRHSPTEDIEGEVTALSDPPVPTREEIAAAAQALCGRIEQRPPAFSALWVGGRRAYELARKGKQVELEPRDVMVYRIEVVDYQYPQLMLDVECGRGTYIRSLGRDLAERLGTAAVMSALKRTAIGGFRVEDAIDPGAITRENLANHLLPPLRAVEQLPRVQLTADDVARLRNGLTIALPKGDGGGRSVEARREVRPDSLPPSPVPGQLAAFDPAGRLVAVVTQVECGVLRATKNLPLE